MRPRSWAALAVTLFALCVPTTNHYWDEYLYVFSVERHPTTALLSMETALADGILPNGFFSGKLGFVVLLSALLDATGAGETGILVLRSLFAAMTLALAWMTWLLLRALLDDRGDAAQAAAILLVLPLSVYLGSKVLSEVPGLLVSTIGGWQLVVALRAPTRAARVRALILAIAGCGLGIVVRITSMLFTVGLIAATLVVRPADAGRRRIAVDGALVLTGALLLAGAVYLVAVGVPWDRFNALAASVTTRRPGGLVALYSVFMFVQLFGLAAAVALVPPVTRAAAGALVWLGVTMSPYLIAAEYVEPRYFYSGLPGLAILASEGLRRLGPLRRPAAAAAVVAGIVLLNRLAFAPLMPHEIRESDYRALVEDVRRQYPDATVVTPWVVDFCFLSTTYPDAPVVLAMSESYGTGGVFSTPSFERWAGAGAYVPDEAALAALPMPHIYVGWEYSPTIVAVDRYLRRMGVTYLGDDERRGRLLNHLTPSWIWREHRDRLEPVASRGLYRAYAIRMVDGR